MLRAGLQGHLLVGSRPARRRNSSTNCTTARGQFDDESRRERLAPLLCGRVMTSTPRLAMSHWATARDDDELPPARVESRAAWCLLRPRTMTTTPRHQWYRGKRDGACASTTWPSRPSSIQGSAAPSKRAACVNKRAGPLCSGEAVRSRRSIVCLALSRTRISLLREDEAYRIDHYLGKELVMNVLVLRFANAIFEAVWSRRYVERVEICCLEEVDCKGRGGYFDAYGIIRDVMQNHLAQLLALVAMEQPLSLKADDVRREKVRALRACKVLDSRDVIRGQYDGYADDSSITNKKTTTETFAACKLFVDTYCDGVLMPTRSCLGAMASDARRRRRVSPAQAALGRRPVHLDRGQGPPGEEGRGAHCVSRSAVSSSGVARRLSERTCGTCATGRTRLLARREQSARSRRAPSGTETHEPHVHAHGGARHARRL